MRMLPRKVVLASGLLLASVLSAQTGNPALDEATAAYRQGKTAEAEQILETILKKQPDELDALVLMGIVLDTEQHYQDAETYYQLALKITPVSAQVLNDVGNHYLSSGDRNRARDMYLKAIAIDAHHVNANLQLAQISVDDKQGQHALNYLSHVSSDANSEPGVLLLQARALALCGRCTESSEILKKFGNQPSDPAVQFSAGMALAECKLYSAAEEAFSRALDADPQNFDVLYNLGLAALRAEHVERAQSVLEIALRQRPYDPDTLYALAQVFWKREQPIQSAALLVRAQKAAPKRADIVLLLAQVSARLGFHEDSAAAYARYLELRPKDNVARREREVELVRAHRALKRTEPKQAVAVNGHDINPGSHTGLMNYLSLSPTDQRARYVARLREQSAADPSNSRLKISLATELFAEGDKNEALKTFEHLEPAALDPVLNAQCGRILIEFEQFGKARPYLESAVAAAPDLSAARLDLAIAVFQLQGADPALQVLDQTPVSDRKGDYYLLRAQILDAQGKVQDAATALNQGMRAAPTRASLYYQAAGFLLKHKLYHEAEALLAQASRILPDDRDLLLAQAVTLNLLRQNVDSENVLERIQARWPEWNRVYLLKGILQAIDLKYAEARQTLETAIALGANTPEAYYYEALAITNSAQPDLGAAQNAIQHALALTSQDPYIYLLAGKISLARKEYPNAIQHLLTATRLQPTLIPAHYALRHAYTAMGDEQKSQAEMETIKHIAGKTEGSEESPFSVEDFLFTVRPPG